MLCVPEMSSALVRTRSSLVVDLDLFASVVHAYRRW
jgi:hypothetical protein